MTGGGLFTKAVFENGAAEMLITISHFNISPIICHIGIFFYFSDRDGATFSARTSC